MIYQLNYDVKHFECKNQTVVYEEFVSGKKSSIIRSSSSSHISEGDENTATRTPQVGLTSDGSTIICWHPEPTFPYKYTKPLPRQTTDVTEGDSVLKVQLVRDYELRHRAAGPTVKELSNIFHTSKHRWYPNKQTRYRKPNPPKDRDGI